MQTLVVSKVQSKQTGTFGQLLFGGLLDEHVRQLIGLIKGGQVRDAAAFIDKLGMKSIPVRRTNSS